MAQNKKPDKLLILTHYILYGIIALLFVTVTFMGAVQAATPSKNTYQAVYTGIWTGTLGQKPGSYSEAYPFSLVLSQSGTTITGFSRIEGIGGPYAVMSISGKVNGKNISLSEKKFIENIPPEGTYWLLKDLTLILNTKNSSVLEGTWEDTRHDPLGFGVISLSKCPDCMIPAGSSIIIQPGEVSKIVNSSNVSKIRLYSRSGCKTCDTIRELLTRYNFAFEDINPETVKGTDAVAIKKDFLVDNPKKIVPVIVYGTQRFVGVTDNDIKTLRESGFLPKIF